MSEIYESTPLFNLVKRYVRFTFVRFYSEFIVIGKENIPTNAPVIFAPNHNNALMDALAIHAAAPHDLPIVFLARADIFNNKTAAKILRFCKMMPAFRMRDGVENLEKNNAIFKRCVDVLDHNKALGIMPEGNQGEQRKLRPLMKGIFRIAFAAQEKHGSLPCVKIIPVGIDYGDYIKSHKHIILSFGKPIEVSDYMSDYIENPVSATNEIRNRLKNDLSHITLDLATEEYYDCFETAVEVANRTFQDKVKLPKSTVSLFVARHKIADRLLGIEKNNPDSINRLNEICEEYRTLLKKMNLRTAILEQAPYKSLHLLFEGFFLFTTSLLFLYGFILNFLPFFAPIVIRKYIFKAQYEGFFSSLHFGLGLITFPLFYLLQTVLFCSFVDSYWWIILLFFISQYFLGRFALLWYSVSRKFIAKLRYVRCGKSKIMVHVQKLRLNIIQILTSEKEIIQK